MIRKLLFFLAMIVSVWINILFAQGNADPSVSKETQNTPIEFKRLAVEEVQPEGINREGENKFRVGDNVPNPFSKKTQLHYSVPGSTEVSISIYNILGKEVYFTSCMASSGHNMFELNTGDLSTGVYIYTISSDSESITKKMVINNASGN